MGYIATDRVNYGIGSEITVSGSVDRGSLFRSLKYELLFGAHGVTDNNGNADEIQIRSELSADNIKSGVKFTPNDSYARFAWPYDKGRLCYIKAVGWKGSAKAVEYITYINLYADLMPKFTFMIVANSAEFGTVPVKGYSKLTPKVNITELKHGQSIKNVKFSGGLIGGTVAGVAGQTEYSKESDILAVSGTIDLIATVTTSLGYTVTKTQRVTVAEYEPPRLAAAQGESAVLCYRTDATGAEIGRNADKNALYGLRFKARLLPGAVKDFGNKLKGTVIVRLSRPGSTDAVIELTSQTLPESGAENVDIDISKTAEELGGGLRLYQTYLISVELQDAAGAYTVTRSLRTITTTFHLRHGGNGAKFGGYATKDNVLGSAWPIECDGDISGEQFVGNSLKLGETAVDGFGSGENKAALGNHTHGDLQSDGKMLDDDGVVAIKQAIVTDETGYLSSTPKLVSDFLAMGLVEGHPMQENLGFTELDEKEEITYNPLSNEKLSVNKINKAAGSPGNAGLCYADHTHPYSRSWLYDPIFKAIINALSVAHTDYL
jgi:hypothetical protein